VTQPVRASASRRTGDGDDSGVVAILLTDVEPAVRINAALEGLGHRTVAISPMDDVRGELRRAKPMVVVFTGALLDAAHVALVRQLLWDNVSVIGLVDVADPALMERLRDIGYAEVWEKPVVVDDVVDSIRRRIERRQLAELTGLVGESAAIREVLVKVEQIAPVTSTVLIEGESGTGKELVARAVHRLSPRRGKPFIAVNVGALPETLLESELFGHEKGAFTGAAERRLGRFELADTGTLFLDEIGEIPQSTQVKLLRVLEEREVTRVGGGQSIPVDVRVVAATNRPLREHVEEGHFRADLFYRLNVLSVYLPPLRERREDIPLLVRRFVSEFSALHDRAFNGISPEALALLVEYHWPGNVRELRNLVESMVVLAHGREIVADDIPRAIRDGGGRRLLPVPVGPMVQGAERAQGRELEFIVRSLVELKLQVEELRRRMDVEQRPPMGWVGEVHSVGGHPQGVHPVGGQPVGVSPVGNGHVAAPLGGDVGVGPVVPAAGLRSGDYRGGEIFGIEPRDQAIPATVITLGPGMTMAEIERVAIQAALRDSGGNRRKAAERLGIGERTLYRKLREYEGETGPDDGPDGEET
jgi:DNA-binding NtrC family response regulator